MTKYNCEIFIGGPADGQLHYHDTFRDERIPAAAAYDPSQLLEPVDTSLDYVRTEIQPAGTSNTVLCYVHESLSEQEAVALVFDWLLEEAELPEVTPPVTFPHKWATGITQFDFKISKVPLSAHREQAKRYFDEWQSRDETIRMSHQDILTRWGAKAHFGDSAAPSDIIEPRSSPLEDILGSLDEKVQQEMQRIRDGQAEQDRAQRARERARRSK